MHLNHTSSGDIMPWKYVRFTLCVPIWKQRKASTILGGAPADLSSIMWGFLPIFNASKPSWIFVSVFRMGPWKEAYTMFETNKSYKSCDIYLQVHIFFPL